MISAQCRSTTTIYGLVQKSKGIWELGFLLQDWERSNRHSYELVPTMAVTSLLFGNSEWAIGYRLS